MKKAIILLVKALRSLKVLLCPSNRTEQKVLLFSFVYFMLLVAYYLCFVPFSRDLGMMGYDSPIYILNYTKDLDVWKVFGWNIRHPLFNLFYLPVICINEVLLLLNIDISLLLFLLPTTVMMSLTVLMIFKILRAEGLSVFYTLVCVAFFCSLAHVMFLSLMVESFVMTLFLTLLLVSYSIRRDIKSTAADNLLLMGVAGATLTNAAKVFSVFLLQDGKLKSKLIRIIKSVFLFCGCLMIVFPGLVARFIENKYGWRFSVFGDSFGYTGTSMDKSVLLVDNFLSEPFLFHHANAVYTDESTQITPYPHMWMYAIVIIILLLMLVSAIINFKCHIARLFGVFWGIDVFVAFGIGYGVQQCHLVSGHWLGFVPLMLGLLLVNVHKWYIKWVTGGLILTTMFFLVYNLNFLF